MFLGVKNNGLSNKYPENIPTWINFDLMVPSLKTFIGILL